MISDDGKDFTWHIFYNDEYSQFSNYYAVDYDSFIHQRESKISIEVLEDCELVIMEYQDLEYFFCNIQKTNIIGRIFAQEAYGTAHQYMLSYLSDSASVRFKKFMKIRKDWFDKIPQHQIATHLGITPQSLSRLKTKISSVTKC